MIIFGTPKGSLEKSFENLANRCGLFSDQSDDRESLVKDPKVTMIKLRPQDIPLYVARGNLDLGLTGEDCLAERGLQNAVGCISTLLLSRSGQQCVRVALYVKESSEYGQVSDLAGKLVATEFPNIAGEYFRSMGVSVSLDISHGATEAIVDSGFAEAGVDIVDSGLSLAQFKLRVVATLMISHSILIASPKALVDPEKVRAIEIIRHKLAYNG